MTTLDLDTTAPLVKYGTTPSDLLVLRQQYSSLTCETRDGYVATSRAISSLTHLRTSVEKRRKDLKRDALEWERLVDSEARKLTGMIEEIEQPLRSNRQIVDDAKARDKAAREEEARRIVEEEQRRKFEAEQAVLREAREAEEARLRAEREAVAAELKAEAKRLAEERAAMEAEYRQAEAARLAEEQRHAEARAKLDAERRKLDAERRAAALAEFDRQVVLQAEQEYRERAERDRIAAEEATIASMKRAAELQQRRESLRPDAERLRHYAGSLRAVPVPEVRSEEATAAVLAACVLLGDLCQGLETAL